MQKQLPPDMNLYLIGPMGAGKSSVGMKLAQLCDRNFLDSDQEIEKRCGVSISWIFEKELELGFRQRESAVVQELCQFKTIVLSTGGGVVLNPSNRALLKQSGFVIYLKVSLQQQLERVLLRQQTRPLLQETSQKSSQGYLVEKLTRLYQERTPLYEEIADLTIITDAHTPTDIAKKIERALCLNPL